MPGIRTLQTAALTMALVCGLCQLGCVAVRQDPALLNVIPPESDVPRELAKVTLPQYVIEPPDILAIDAVRVVPRSPYRVNILDVLVLQVLGTLPDSPIAGPFTVEPGGTINLGVPYGMVKVVGLTTDEVAATVQAHLKKHLKEPEVSVTLGDLASKQDIAGEHLVSQDGTVMLGTYGSVYVVGMTLAEAKSSIEQHLSQYLEAPEVAVDVFAYNSKVYYIITQGAGMGDGVVRFPITGNETVLDAISQINGLDTVSSKRIWIARPAAPGEMDQILPVDWCAITSRGSSVTNYQILPGDRLFVAEDKLIAFDTGLAKIIAPMERLFGVTLLGTSTVSDLRFFHRGGGNNSGNGIGGGF